MFYNIRNTYVLTIGSVGIQCCTISVSILGISSYDHVKTSLNSVRSATNASFSEMVKVLPLVSF